MFDILGYEFVWRAVAASVLGGAACGIIGVWVILLNIPFVGVAMSHSAFAGAVFGLLLGLNPLVCALVFCVISAFLIGPVADRGDVSVNVSIGIIFSFVLGLAFLGIGLLKGPKTEALNFLWGSILTALMLRSPCSLPVWRVYCFFSFYSTRKLWQFFLTGKWQAPLAYRKKRYSTPSCCCAVLL